MSIARKRARPPSDERGFALVVVLWLAGLLAVLTASFALTVGTRLRVAGNVAESARAEALADAGASLAVLDLVDAHRTPDYQRRFPADGRPVPCSIDGEGALSVSVTDEAAKIDLNTAGVPLLQALMVGLGEAPDRASQIADAIFDYRDADDTKRPNGAESAEYRAAGLGWLPKNAPFQSVEELAQVPGMTPQLLTRMQPWLGVHTGLAGVDASLASQALIDLLRAGLEGTAGAFGSFPELNAAVALPDMFVTASQQKVFDLRIEARTETGAVFVREAVVDIGSSQPPQPVFMRWTRGSRADGKAGASGRSPHC
jgi:general secretion pathway protein K